MRHIWLLTVIWIIFSAGNIQAVESVSKKMNRVQKNLASKGAFVVNFQQSVIEVELFGKKTLSSGIFYFKSPDYFRMNFRVGDEHDYISDGHLFWRLNQKSLHIDSGKLDRQGNPLPLFFNEKKLHQSCLVSFVDTHIGIKSSKNKSKFIQVLPKKGSNLAFLRATIALRGITIESIHMEMPNGNITQLKFSDFKVRSLAKSYFQPPFSTTPPKHEK